MRSYYRLWMIFLRIRLYKTAKPIHGMDGSPSSLRSLSPFLVVYGSSFTTERRYCSELAHPPRRIDTHQSFLARHVWAFLLWQQSSNAVHYLESFRCPFYLLKHGWQLFSFLINSPNLLSVFPCLWDPLCLPFLTLLIPISFPFPGMVILYFRKTCLSNDHLHPSLLECCLGCMDLVIPFSFSPFVPNLCILEFLGEITVSLAGISRYCLHELLFAGQSHDV